MDSPETYNRVKHIEKSAVKHLLLLLTAISLAVAVTTAIAIIFLAAPLVPSLIVISCSLVSVALAQLLKKVLKKQCRFCNGKLDYITRPMILSAEYLSMQGIKKGEAYYAPCQWGRKHSPTGWAKITHRATACHHCRISREGYRPHFETLSAEELTAIKQ